MSDLGTSASVMINAPVERVWEALTVPEQIKQWFFGVDTESDWKAGSALVHRGEWKGKPYVDKGKILGSRPRPSSSIRIGAISPASLMNRRTIRRSPGP